MSHLSTTKEAMLPKDAVLLPTSTGGLLISRSLAVFCPIRHAEVAALETVLAGNAGLGVLSSSTCRELRRHGFFDAPRTTRAGHPSVRFQLTNRCNLECSYCCTDSREAREKELGEAQWRDLVDEAIAFETVPPNFHLLGGEPLLLPFTARLGEHILDRGAHLTLFTNGVPLGDAETADRIAALIHRGCEVRVSLAGVREETCDRLSGGNRFRAACDGIRALARRDAPVHVDVMLFPETVSETAAHFYAFRQTLPKRTVIAFGIAYCGGRETGAHMFETRDDLEAALDTIVLETGAAIPPPKSGAVTDRREACPCAFGHDIHVRSDGVLFNCFKMEEPLGRYPDRPLAAVWSHARKACRPATLLPTCRDCALATLCGGGCRSENALYTGDPDTPVCGPWRVRLLSELLAENRTGALEWPLMYLVNEAERRGIPVDVSPAPRFLSFNNSSNIRSAE